MKKGVVLSAVILTVSLLITACSANQSINNSESSNISVSTPAESEVPNETEKSPEKTGVIAEQILNGNDGDDAGLRHDVVRRRFFGKQSELERFSGMDRTSRRYDCRFCTAYRLARNICTAGD